MTNYKFASLVLIFCGVFFDESRACLHPSPVADYTNDKYSGLWYEVGRIQTPGGASYQQSCFCDTANFTSQFPTVGNGKVTYSCRQDSADGPTSQATATLVAGEVPGNFAQYFFIFGPSVDYNVIWLDEDSAMEYDCRTSGDTEEYCVHFMSKTPELSPEKLQAMLQFAESLGLDTQNVGYKPTRQEGCW